MFQVLWNILKYVYNIIYSLLRPVRRVVCRRRKLSTSGEMELTSISTGNIRISTPQQYGDDDNDADLEMKSWDAWENGGSGNKSANGYHGVPSLGRSSINNYHYHQQQQQQQLEEPEPEPDFFQDMTPTVKKQKKILIRKKEDPPAGMVSSRLAVASDVPLVTSELEAWEDESNAWESGEITEDLTLQAEETLRETRRKERAQRVEQHQRRKQQKEMERGRGGTALATKIS